ncbi:MAG: hypothetical protein NVS2B12_11220 [Ktedonobacteraceae bacterium]
MFNPGDQQIKRFSNIRNHLLSVMPRATIGLADLTVVRELEDILVELSALFNELSPQRPACDPIQVQSTMAETMVHLAHAHDALRNIERALHWYEQATSTFEAIGQLESARQCRDASERLCSLVEGMFDAEFQRLQERLAAQPHNSLPHIETLIALGNLYKDAEDLFEAEKTYILAENALKRIIPPPLDSSASRQLEQLLLYYQEIEFLYDLHYRLCSNMMYLYRDRDSAQARKYFQRARESESMRSEYRHNISTRLVGILIDEVCGVIESAARGIQADIQLRSSLRGLEDLAARNISLPIDVPRDELLQELYKLLKSIEAQGEFRKLIYFYQSHVQQISSLIQVMYQKQAIERRVDMMRLLEVQVAFDALRQDIQVFATQTPEQQTLLTDKLLQRIQELSDESQRLDLLEGVTTALILKAQLLMTLERNNEAITVLEEAQRMSGDYWQHDRGVVVLSSLAEVHARKSDWVAVEKICRQGIEIVEQYRYRVTGQYLQNSYLISRIRLYSLGVRATYELKNYELMLQWSELSKCRSVLRYRQRTLIPTQGLQTTEQEFQRVCEQLHAVSPDSVFLQEMKQKRRTLWDLLLIQRHKKQTGEDFPEFSLQKLQKTLAIDEAVVYYYWLDKYTLLIISIDQQSVISELRVINQEKREELEKFAYLVLHLRDLENEGDELQAVVEFSELLLPQAGMPLLKQKQRLLISPHQLLHVIPFHALQWEDDPLIQHFAVSYVPNLTCLLLRYLPPTKPDVLALGVREYAIPRKHADNLEDAESEVEDIQHIYESSGTVTVLRGPEGRREELQLLENQGKLERFTCLHFAIHGESVMNDTPMESYLLLQNTLLDGLEIANWRLDAETVVLSACCSGQRAIAGRGLAELPGDEMLGLQAAFFCAGAKRLLCSLWPVDSSVSRKMSVLFHRYLTQNYIPEIALQMAMKDYLASARLRSRRLCYWSPFFLSTLARPDLTSTSSIGGTTYGTSI